MRAINRQAWYRRTLGGLTILCLAALPLGRADVYELFPGGHGETPDRLLGAKTVLKETVTVNGVPGQLDVSISDKSMGEAKEALASVLAQTKQPAAGNAILIDFPGDATLTRYYVLNFGANLKTVIFALRIPKAELGQPAARFWPAELPSPSGTVEQVIQLARSKGTFATFSNAGPGADVVSRFDSQLVGSGWERVSADGQRGGVYLNKRTQKLLIVSSVTGERETQTTIYLRPIGE